jgi:DNA-binding MarR family transcriptional regulator
MPGAVREAHPHLLGLEDADPSSALVFGSFLRASRLHRQLMLRAFADHGLPPGQALCLRILAAHEGATQREIGDLLQVSPPTVTSMLKRMEAHGLVARDADPADRRVTRVRLAPRGDELERSLRGILAGRVDAILDAMPVDERTELARLLGCLADRMDEALDADPDDERP